jgi:hypothetical protein
VVCNDGLDLFSLLGYPAHYYLQSHELGPALVVRIW